MGCFYKNGLRFECKNCGHCCSDEPGYVFLSQEDISNLSAGLGIDEKDFTDTYCRVVEFGALKMISLLEKENYDCIFLSDKGCMLYDYRPKQCRTYPFWAHILESEDQWNKESHECPGINHGKLYTKKDIDEYLNDRLGNNPVIL